MNKTSKILMSLLLLAGVACGSVYAQTGAAGQNPAAGAGTGRDPGMGPKMGWRMNRGNTPGYSLMTPEERKAHREKMRSFRNYDDCKAYIDEHHKQMQARAREQGKTLPEIKADPCARMVGTTPAK